MFRFLLILCLLAMSDFPPNLEDGEQWLPSDIYEEIISEFPFKPKAQADNVTQNLAIKIESFKHGDNKVVRFNYGKTRGTGVFIPQMTQPKYEPKYGIRNGTGVFLPSICRCTDCYTNNPNKWKGGAAEGVHNQKENNPAKKVLFQPSPDISFLKY